MSQTKVELIDGKTATVNLKNPATADNSTMNLVLQTGETDIAADDVIGKISFQAPDEGTGTDAILVAAGIQAVSEGDFSSSNNATQLEFLTGASEAAAAKMYVKSNGNVSIGTANPIMSGYDANSTRLTVYDGSGSAQSGYLELGANASTNGYNAGAITFVNENNADATNNDADGKTVAQIRSTIVTSDSNAGDDSGAAIELWTKAEAGSLTKRWQVLSDGNLLPNATSTGVYLGVTAATAANLLDDYEEGTWTAVLSGTGSSSGQGYDNQTMRYTKIGRLVYITGMLDMNDLGTLGGDYLKVTGLPFTPDASNSTSYQPISTHHLNVAGDTTGGAFGWTVYGANTFMYVFEHTNGGATQATTSGDYEDGTIVGFSGGYLTS